MRDRKKRVADSGVTRRSFMKGSAGAVVAAGCLQAFGLHAHAAAGEARAGQVAAARVYVCPPCGLPCDKLTFDKPGNCPQCGMKLIPADGGEGTPPSVAVLVYDGAEIIDFAGPWEVFGTAGFLVHTVAESLEPRTMVFGQKVVADYTFENSPRSDVLLVPGGGYEPALKNARLVGWIQSKSKEVGHVMSVCTGAFLLAGAGLLDGLSATVTYGMEDALAKDAPRTRVLYPRRFVDAGKVITTAGLTSGIDGALHLVSKILGDGEAQSAALGMEYRWSPDSDYSRAALADRYLPDGLQYGKANLRGARAAMLSTGGDTERWETRILISQPKTPAEIIDLLGKRIKSNTSHTRGTPALDAQAASSQLKWKFRDDRGRGWRGVAVAEPSPREKDKFVLTLRLARERRPA